MTGSTAAKHAVGALFVGLGLVASACGDSADNADKAAATGSEVATASSVDLTPALMRADEEPGFRLGALPDSALQSRETITGVDAFAQEMALPPAEVQRLLGEGFISFTVAPIRGPRNTGGLTNAALYETAEGAKRSMAHDLRPEVIRAHGPIGNLRFFPVPGVPHARGWTASEPHVANVLWVQGRCYLTLGNQGPGRLEGRLSTGVRAIYERTNGLCP